MPDDRPHEQVAALRDRGHGLFWALAAVAGCHLPHLPMSAPQLPTMSATAMGHAVAAAVEHAPPGAHPCSPMDRNCQQAAQACTTTDLVALAVAAALTVVFASPAWPVVSTPAARHGPTASFHIGRVESS